MDLSGKFISWRVWQREEEDMDADMYIHSIMMILLAIVISLCLCLVLKLGTDWESQYILLLVPVHNESEWFWIIQNLIFINGNHQFNGNDTGLSSFDMQIVKYGICTRFAFNYSQYLSSQEYETS